MLVEHAPLYKLIVSKSWHGARGLVSPPPAPETPLPAAVAAAALLSPDACCCFGAAVTDAAAVSLIACDAVCFLLPSPSGKAKSCGSLRIILPDVISRPKPS